MKMSEIETLYFHHLQSILPLHLSQNPDGTSMRNIVHFAQMVNSGKMQKYDHGFLTNIQIYVQV